MQAAILSCLLQCLQQSQITRQGTDKWHSTGSSPHGHHAPEMGACPLKHSAHRTLRPVYAAQKLPFWRSGRDTGQRALCAGWVVEPPPSGWIFSASASLLGLGTSCAVADYQVRQCKVCVLIHLPELPPACSMHSTSTTIRVKTGVNRVYGYLRHMWIRVYMPDEERWQ